MQLNLMLCFGSVGIATTSFSNLGKQKVNKYGNKYPGDYESNEVEENNEIMDITEALNENFEYDCDYSNEDCYGDSNGILEDSNEK